MITDQVKVLLKQAFKRLGYRITRWRPTNRFQAMEDTLAILRKQGYTPRTIIDGGANKGQWSKLALGVFPEARFHLIEPQPACRGALEQLAAKFPAVTVHPVALTEPGIKKVTMLGVDATGNTGAFVVTDDVTQTAAGARSVPATSLDQLLGPVLRKEDRPLLKFDLEGHELAALRGAEQTLSQIEVILTETHIYDPEHLGRATFADCFTHLSERGFVLFDVASLSERSRDSRLRQGDFVFVNGWSALLKDTAWS